MGRMKSLTNKSLWWFVGCTATILLISTPLFYFLTRHYYAEEMVDLIENVQRGQEIPPSDLESDIMAGVMIQFALIVAVLSVASVVTMRFVSRCLWTPFYDAMHKTEKFDLDKEVPQFAPTDISEFATLNNSLTELMRRNRDTFQSQKEFTQNASHELQTPLAVIQGKLDLLLQENLGKRQLRLVQDMYKAGNRMARLNRSLLLLAKIDNSQYRTDETVVMNRLLTENIAVCKSIFNRQNITCEVEDDCRILGNGALTEILVNNLLMNAMRNTPSEGHIGIRCSRERFEIGNTALSGGLDAEHLFDRFGQTSGADRGNGIGLSIVKAVCNYHGWSIGYAFGDSEHRFTVLFGKPE